MSKKVPDHPTRIARVFLEELEKIPTMRVRNGVEERTNELTPAELTRMLVGTEGWQLSKKELVSKPRRKI